jgi:hypothetical protein
LYTDNICISNKAAVTSNEKNDGKFELEKMWRKTTAGILNYRHSSYQETLKKKTIKHIT